ncbi:MAG: hypothetical protein AAFV53_40225 [Myxococcota bacterium]
MTTMTVRELLVRLGVTNQTRQDLRVVQRFDRALDSTKRTMAMVTGASVVLGAALSGVVLQTARLGDETAKNADRMQIPIETYQELAFAAERSDASMKTLRTAFQRQASSALDAQGGVKAAVEAYQALGVEVTGADGALKGQEQLFLEVAEALSGVENETLRAALAQDVWGRSAAELFPLIKNGADGIEALRMEARELGFVMSAEAARQAEVFTDRMTDLQSVAIGLRNQVGNALIPTLIEAAEAIQGWYLENRQLIEQRIEDWADRLAGRLERLWRQLAAVVDAVGGWEVAFQRAGLALAGLLGLIVGGRLAANALAILQALQAAIGAIAVAAGVSFGAAAAGVAALVFGVVALGLAVEDLITFMNGGQSAIGDFFAAFGLEDELMDRLVRGMDAISRSGMALFGIFSVLSGAFSAVFNEDVVGVSVDLGEALHFISTVALAGWLGQLEGINLAFELLAGFLERIESGLQRLSRGAGGFTTSFADGLSSLGINDPGLQRAGAELSALAAPSANALPGAGRGPVTVQQGDIVVQGVSAGPSEIQEMIRGALEEQQRQAMAAVAAAGEA